MFLACSPRSHVSRIWRYQCHSKIMHLWSAFHLCVICASISRKKIPLYSGFQDAIARNRCFTLVANKLDNHSDDIEPHPQVARSSCHLQRISLKCHFYQGFHLYIRSPGVHFGTHVHMFTVKLSSPVPVVSAAFLLNFSKLNSLHGTIWPDFICMCGL